MFLKYTFIEKDKIINEEIVDLLSADVKDKLIYLRRNKKKVSNIKVIIKEDELLQEIVENNCVIKNCCRVSPTLVKYDYYFDYKTFLVIDKMRGFGSSAAISNFIALYNIENLSKFRTHFITEIGEDDVCAFDNYIIKTHFSEFIKGKKGKKIKSLLNCVDLDDYAFHNLGIVENGGFLFKVLKEK